MSVDRARPTHAAQDAHLLVERDDQVTPGLCSVDVVLVVEVVVVVEVRVDGIFVRIRLGFVLLDVLRACGWVSRDLGGKVDLRRRTGFSSSSLTFALEPLCC